MITTDQASSMKDSKAILSIDGDGRTGTVQDIAFDGETMLVEIVDGDVLGWFDTLDVTPVNAPGATRC